MRQGIVLILLWWSSRADAQPRPRHDAEPSAIDEPPVQEISPDEPEPEPPPKPTPVAPPTKQDESVHTMDEMTIPKSYLRFGINFFGDTSLVITTPGEPHSSFAIGTLGVRLLGELSRSLDALAEVGFETTTGPVADVEQLALRWRRGPAGTPPS